MRRVVVFAAALGLIMALVPAASADDGMQRGELAESLAAALNLHAGGAPQFDDVGPDHPQAEAIAAVDEADIVAGYGDGTFRPDAAVNRAQAAAFLAHAFDLEGEGPTAFRDVPAEHVHVDAVAAVAAAGITVGIDDERYGPALAVTHQHMETFLARAGVPSEGFTSEPVEGEGQHNDAMAQLSDVRMARHSGYDRVVLEFANGILPDYRVAHDDPPFHRGEGDQEAHVEGDSFLMVELPWASDRDGHGTPTYEGPERVHGDTAKVTAAKHLTPGHYDMRWVIGKGGPETPYRVRTLEDPARLVIDVRH